MGSSYNFRFRLFVCIFCSILSFSVKVKLFFIIVKVRLSVPLVIMYVCVQCLEKPSLK